MYEAKQNRSKRSQKSVLNSKLNSSEENNLPCSGGRGGELDGVRDKIARVALAHLLAWGEIKTGSNNNKDSGKIEKFYHQINYNAGQLDPLAGILSRHLSKGAELYYM